MFARIIHGDGTESSDILSELWISELDPSLELTESAFGCRVCVVSPTWWPMTWNVAPVGRVPPTPICNASGEANGEEEEEEVSAERDALLPVGLRCLKTFGLKLGCRLACLLEVRGN